MLESLYETFPTPVVSTSDKNTPIRGSMFQKSVTISVLDTDPNVDPKPEPDPEPDPKPEPEPEPVFSREMYPLVCICMHRRIMYLHVFK